MKICVLVKEVPDAAVVKKIDPTTKRLDRSGEKNLNPYDQQAIEAAMQLKEGGVVKVDDIVAVTMGPESAVRALHKAVSLGADRSIHLSDPVLAGSDVAALKSLGVAAVFTPGASTEVAIDFIRGAVRA